MSELSVLAILHDCLGMLKVFCHRVPRMLIPLEWQCKGQCSDENFGLSTQKYFYHELLQVMKCGSIIGTGVPTSGNVMVCPLQRRFRCNCWLETWSLVSWDPEGILLMDSMPHRTVTVKACAVLRNIKAVIKEEQGDVTKVFCFFMTLFPSQKQLLTMDCGFEE
jgi:hypothetical protein